MHRSGILLFMFLTLCLQTTFAIVQTNTGPISGTTDTYANKILHVYLGIPYATPPTGNLRFRKTVPVQSWTSIYPAHYYAPACVQYYPYPYPWVDWMPGQSEDCLYLNIWAPDAPDERKPKAVMFWIYGGGFSTGSNRKEVYDGRVLAATGDVIVVTVNYRLGVFGFLSTSSEEAPGNMGLYDVLEALKWVNNNIEAFGGDPNSITIFGESVGAFATGLLCVSPLTTGLFQRVILESGAPVMFTEAESYQKNLALAGRLSVAVGCAPNNDTIVENPSSVVECLRTKDPSLLAFTVNSFNPGLGPTFNFVYGDELLPTNPRLAILDLQLQNVDVLIGNVQDEGSYRVASIMPNVFGVFGEKNPSINRSFGEDIIKQLFNGMPFTEAVVQRYLRDVKENDYDKVLSQVSHSNGDFVFFCPTAYFAESYARKGSAVYYYYFNHRPSVTPWAPWVGVAHFSEVPFVFGRPLDSSEAYSESEKSLSKEMIQMLTNFAKFGKPSPDWLLFTRQNPRVLTFSLPGDGKSYLTEHFENCNFFRPIFGFL